MNDSTPQKELFSSDGLFILLIILVALSVGIGILFKRKSGSKQANAVGKVGKSIYDVLTSLQEDFLKENLIDERDINALKDKAQKIFLEEAMKIIDSQISPVEKKEKLINLYSNWKNQQAFIDLENKVEKILEKYKKDLESKRREEIPLPFLLSRYSISADNAYEALKNLINKLIESGVNSAKELIKVKIEFLEKDEEEDSIEERLKGIREKIKAHLI